MRHISYYENERDMGERHSSESMEEIVVWFKDSYRHHVGKDPDGECVDMLVGTGGVCRSTGNMEYELVLS